jgi:hypothetical protein
MPNMGNYFEAGAEVKHPIYGVGKIIARECLIGKLYYRVEFNGHSMSVHHEQLTHLEEELT